LMNPVKAKLTARPEAWSWSSAAAYVKGRTDGLTNTRPMLKRIDDIKAFLGEKPDLSRLKTLLAAGTIGRPAAEPDFIKQLEAQTGRSLLPEKRGPKPAKVKRKPAKMKSGRS
jgi:putative transposase